MIEVDGVNEEPEAEDRHLRGRRGQTARLPLFLPVYQARGTPPDLDAWGNRYPIEGCIVNAYFLYKQRSLRETLGGEVDIHDFIGFDGIVMTDSGAFQGLTRPLLLSNRDIVRFQDALGADVISPLDVITPPGDKRSVAEKKLDATIRRVREAAELVPRDRLAGVQQGGRFLDLRRRATDELLELGVEYLAIGSLVPFFNPNHDLRFVRQVIEEARSQAGPSLPIHVYGAGDPVELPLLVRYGATVFDSSSYAHYAKRGVYMTPFGGFANVADAIASGYDCSCGICAENGPQTAAADDDRLAAHNLATLLDCMRRIREALESGSLDAYVDDVLSRHLAWFPTSGLRYALD